MSNVRVRVSGSLRGELTIAPLNFILKANNVINVAKEDFFSSNVQLAVQKGILLVEELPEDVKQDLSANMVKLVNTTQKTLSLQKSGLVFKANGTLIVHRDVIKSKDVCEALGSGALDTCELDEVVVAKPKPAKTTPKPKNVDPNKNQKTLSDIKKEEEKVITDPNSVDMEDLFLTVQRESVEKEMAATDSEMGAWNPGEGLLGKDESTEAVMDQQHMVKQDEPDIPEVDFVDMSKEEADDGVVMVDPDEDAKKRSTKKKTTKKKTTKKKTAKKKSAKKKTTKKKTTKKVAEKKEEAPAEKKPELDDAFVEKDQPEPEDLSFIDDDKDDDVSFVDQEQEEERISGQKSRIADMNEEIS